jgi:dolichol-phosphate mannosyltransferase
MLKRDAQALIVKLSLSIFRSSTILTSLSQGNLRVPKRKDNSAICIVIPTYNEKENILNLIPKIEKTGKKTGLSLSILIVDDASPDGTAEAAEELSETYDNLAVLRRAGKLGIGSAYKDGFKRALDNQSDIIVEMDADLSHNPKYLPNLIDEVHKGSDLVIGSRYVPGGSVPGWSFMRRLTSKGANFYAKTLLGLDAKDVTSGYRAFKSSSLLKADYSTVSSEGYMFQVEMVHRFKEKGLKTSEIPIEFVDRRKGESKLGLDEISKFAIGIFGIFLKRIF